MLKRIFSFIAVLLATTSFAQTENSPVAWEVKVNKQGQGYQLEAHAKLYDGFHIWAMDAGGDGSLINTEVILDTDNVKWQEDNWSVSPDATPINLDYIDGTIFWHEKEVKIQRNIAKDYKGEIAGAILYQVCNEEFCYPPAEFEFTVEL